MGPDSRKRLWLVAVVVVAAALAFAGPSLIAGRHDTAVASNGCGMDHGSSSGGCGTTGGTQTAHQGCAMLSGIVTSIDKRDGSVTVKVKPATDGADAAKKALGNVKVGDNLSMAVMLDKNGRPASPTVQAAGHTCPMHPEVTSDKPGKCPKCGMDLQRVGTGEK